MRRVLAGGLVTLALLATSAVGPAYGCGCGAVVGPPETKVVASSERAIISWSGEREVIELTFDVDSESTAVGLIVPTPTPATITAGDLRTFELIESVIQPTVKVEKDWWGIDYFTPDPEPNVVDTTPRVPLSPIRTTTIAASDAIALQAWLTLNDFVVTDDMASTIRTYGAYGWSFTLISLSSEDVIDGHIDPIRLTFDSNRLVYPMRLARSEPGPQNVRVYLFDEHRNDVTQAAAPTLDIAAEVEDLYAGEVEDSRLKALGPYLSAFDITYDDPGTQVTSDIGFFPSTSDKAVTPTVTEYRPVTLLGIPVGSLIVAWALIGVLLVIGHFRGRRKAR
jgi:hypothetical protein